ncbi:MAG: DUF4270 domain-containing protein [Flavobacteriales bacterium]|nr:DUF4270 domain-containing protein [Flavobacteriales bacterium]
MLLIPGCRKPEADVGLDLLPGDPLGAQLDTALLSANTFADEAVQTSGLTRHLVGSYVDPDFGLLKTGLVAQVRLTTANIGQGQDNSTLVADSVVLALMYEVPNTHYGNLTAQQFRVHRLAEALSVDSTYRSDREPEVDAEDLVYPHRGMITPDPYSNVELLDDTVAPHLRIRLRDELAVQFVETFGDPEFVDNAAFLSFFKGLYVTVDNGLQAPYEGGVLHINTSASTSRLTTYYHDSTEPGTPRKLDMVINSSSARFTSVQRDRTQALNSGLQDALGDPASPNPTVYLQTLGGSRSAVTFPGIMDHAVRGQALAKAELVVPLQGTYYPYYTPPALLFLFRKDEEGNDAFLPDQQNGITGIGGAFDAVDQEYRFNITRYVQQVMNGTLPDEGVVLVAGSSGVSANRVILCGPDHPQTPMRLLLTFTTY